MPGARHLFNRGMGGTVDPQDYSSWLSAGAVLGIVIAVIVLGSILYVFGSAFRALLSGGFQKLRHEWGSPAGDCSYPRCWRRTRYRVTLPATAEGRREHDIHVCEICTTHYEGLPHHRMTDDEVRAYVRQQRKAYRDQQIATNERVRAQNK